MAPPTGPTAAAAAAAAGGADTEQAAAAAATGAAAAAAPPVEVEVKLRLDGPEAHARLAALLEPGRVATHAQENYFFDGPNKELGSRLVVLRLRFYGGDARAVLTLKGKQLLVDGIGRATEVEEVLPDARAARRYLEAPSELLELPGSALMAGVKSAYGLSALVSLGGFRNTRVEASWRGRTLELDETAFDHGTLYELEAETDEPEALREELEALLRGAGVGFSYSKASKFANFVKKTLL